MQVLLNTDPHIDGNQLMADHLESVVKEALARFGDHVTRVEAHVTDTTGHVKPGPQDILCTLEARVGGRDPVIVKDHAGSPHQAIQGAVHKLKRALDGVLTKHDPRRNPSLGVVSEQLVATGDTAAPLP